MKSVAASTILGNGHYVPSKVVTNDDLAKLMTTAATIPLGLSEAWREGRCRRGSNVLMAAFGSGFTWGAAVLKL